MKNCDEMVNSLLERREQYVAKQKRKRTALIRTVSSMCCVCLMALIGLGVWQIGEVNSPIGQTIGSDVNPGVVNTLDETKGGNTNIPVIEENVNSPTTENQIRILEIEKLPADSQQMFFYLAVDDFIRMSHDEINEYYGVNIFPSVPSDLESNDNQLLGIYKRKTSGELYYDGNKIQYSNEDLSRGVAINVDKESLPYDFGNFFANIQSKSVINNVEVGIGQTPIEEFYAEFMYQNVGFRIFAYGLSQDEFVAIIESLLK